jgi:hypothetical protein
MTLFAHIGAFMAIPFLAFSAWFGGGAHMHQWPTHYPPIATSTPPVATTTPPVHTPPHTQAAVTLYSVSKTSGIAVGDTITITGSGFTNDNTILLDGMVAAKNVPITSSIAIACTTDPSCKGGIHQTLIFTIPSSIGPDCKAGQMCPMYMRLLTSGTYNLAVENENGTSNTIAVSIVGTAGIH